MAEVDQELLLSPYRVIDLTDERGLLCGKILADLGADVIQVEPPGGSTARNIGLSTQMTSIPSEAFSGGPTRSTSGASHWTCVQKMAPPSQKAGERS